MSSGSLSIGNLSCKPASHSLVPWRALANQQHQHLVAQRRQRHRRRRASSLGCRHRCQVLLLAACALMVAAVLTVVSCIRLLGYSGLWAGRAPPLAAAAPPAGPAPAASPASCYSAASHRPASPPRLGGSGPLQGCGFSGGAHSDLLGQGALHRGCLIGARADAGLKWPLLARSEVFGRERSQAELPPRLLSTLQIAIALSGANCALERGR